jgi:cation diffusion facilitator family transporter
MVSAVASGSLAVAKFVVGVAIGSLALITDALHSLIDLGATLITWFAVRVGDRPPDEEHHYGHGKIESIAALGQSAMLFLLAGGVTVEAVQRLQTGSAPIAFSYIPFLVLGVEMVVNAWRARAVLKVVRETKSQALEADSLHFASDFFGSIPVIIGLALSAYGFSWADPAAAFAVGIVVAVLGIRMGRHTIATLVDTAPAGVAEKVEAAVAKLQDVAGVARVRARMVGPRYFIDVTTMLPRTLSAEQAATVKENIQGAVAQLLGDADVTVATTPTALDNESMMDRILVIARNRALAVHHVTVHDIEDRLSVSLDLEVDGKLSLRAAHDIADGLEKAIAAELGADVEVETHIEPLQAVSLLGREAPPERVQAVQMTLSELAAEGQVVRDVHDVRVRETDEGEIVNFHCRVDPELPVQTMHESVDALERTLRARSPSIKRVIGHAEPMRS